MKYRTIIEVIADADNQEEALDLAGEFLRGEIEDGVKMKCSTKPLRSYILASVGIFVLLFSTMIGFASIGFTKAQPVSFTGVGKLRACPPPLKTARTTKFKKAWQKEEAKKVLDYVKKD